MHGESVAEIIKTVSFDGYELVGDSLYRKAEKSQSW